MRIHRYPPPRPADGTLSYAWEFAYCWARTAALARRILRTDGMDVLQACNPPDTYFALARLLRRAGVRFVFDQHDLCPETYASRFEQPSAALHRGLLRLEQATYRTADHVIVDQRVLPAGGAGAGRPAPERRDDRAHGPGPATAPPRHARSRAPARP